MIDTTDSREATLTGPALAVTLDRGPRLVVPGQLRDAAALVGNLIEMLGIIFSIPLVILAVGIPIALCVRVLLWIVGVR